MAFTWNKLEDNDLSNAGVWPRTGGPTFVADLWNPADTTAMSSDGTSDRINLAAGTVFADESTDATVAVWLNTSVAPGSAQIIMNQGFDTLGYPFLMQRLGTTGDLRLQVFQDDGGYILSDVAGSLITGEGWVNVTSTIAGDSGGNATVRTFINGVEPSYVFKDFKNAGGFVTFQGSEQFRIGRFTGATMNGFWARPRAASTVFTPAQVLEYYNSEIALLGSPPPNILPRVVDRITPMLDRMT